MLGLNRPTISKNTREFGRIWGLLFLAALIYMLYNGGFQYRGSVNESRFVTPEIEPYLYYFTLVFDIANTLLGLYLGFVAKVKTE